MFTIDLNPAFLLAVILLSGLVLLQFNALHRANKRIEYLTGRVAARRQTRRAKSRSRQSHAPIPFAWLFGSRHNIIRK